MPAHTQKVLLINPPASLFDSLVDYLKIDHERYRLISAGNGSEALDILSREDVSLVVGDFFAPDSSGIDVGVEIQNRWPRMKTLSTAGFDIDRKEDQAREDDEPGSGNPAVRFEPLRQKILKEIAKKEEGFEGTLKNFQLSDLVQMCCLSGVSTAIKVTQDSHVGFLYIKSGEIIHAAYEESVGEEACYQILSWKRGIFETCKAEPFPEPTIDKNWEFLIMEGTRMADEQAGPEGAQETDLRPEGQEAAETGLGSAPSPQEQVRILIVDDSPLMCRVLEEILTTDEHIRVIGIAHNGEEGLEKIDSLKPNLITLDVNMPVMDGGTALRHIMIKNPCPIVIFSRLGSRPSGTILEFLRLGAVDFLLKPKQGADLAGQKKRLIQKIKQAATAKTGNFKRVKVSKNSSHAKASTEALSPCERLVVVASGGGGYAELIRLLPLLPADFNACLLVIQGTSRELLPPLADYLDTVSSLVVRPLEKHVPLLNGHCYIGADGISADIVAEDGNYFLQSEKEDAGESPAGKPFDRLLCSAANALPGRILVVLLSGAEVGDLEGLRSVTQAKGRVIAQQLDSCLLPYSLERAMMARLVDLEGTPATLARQILQGVRTSI
jgi:two-component system, chemotaxis family, protein-glutamate methylesterase/glutaminase